MFEEKMIVEDGANGEIQDVLICPVGKFVGSNAKGEPVHQNFTQESLEAIATSLNQTGKEILCDADHASAKEGLGRNTRAVGWFSKFVANAKGLFGLLKLTKWGRELISNREYRSVSPVFTLNEESQPTALLSVASTNTPAIDVPENTILNTEPTTTQDEVENMTKEELKEFILNVMDERSKAQTAPNEKCDNEKCDNEKAEEDGETSCSECSEGEKNEDVKNEEVSKTDEEEKEDDKPEEKEDEKDDSKTDEEEVIKEESLNQKSTTTIPTSTPEWKNLKGEAFFKWCREHPAEVNAACGCE